MRGDDVLGRLLRVSLEPGYAVAMVNGFLLVVRNTPPEPGVPCDWSEVDAICRERSMLLD